MSYEQVHNYKEARDSFENAKNIAIQNLSHLDFQELADLLNQKIEEMEKTISSAK